MYIRFLTATLMLSGVTSTGIFAEFAVYHKVRLCDFLVYFSFTLLSFGRQRCRP